MAIEVRVVPYDGRWPVRFEEERRVLERVLAPWVVTPVQHIGSTSIPGISAKPVLDMMVGIRDLREASDAMGPLREVGYVFAPHRPHEALWFFKAAPPAEDVHTHHLHLTAVDSRLWLERLAFRNALRADPELRDEYEALKIRLAAAHSQDGVTYTENKRAFVARVLAAAGIDLGGGSGTVGRS
jgi:GrpB-like predicted nucleotidyltransferase (UPF0157 family)